MWLMALRKRRKAVPFGAVFILLTLCASAQVAGTGAEEVTKCDGTSLAVPHCRHKLDAGPFSILAPSGWEFHQSQGIDSYVGEFVGNGVVLTFDFGAYSNPLKHEKEPAYVVVHKSIGGLRAKIVSPRTPGHGVTGVYFRHVGGSNALCLFGHDLTSTQQELALKIFETVRFGGPIPRFVVPPPPPAKNVH